MASGAALTAALLLIGLPLAGAAAQQAAQTAVPPAAQVEPEMPPLPSLEGQQGDVISHGAVSAPARKRRTEVSQPDAKGAAGRKAAGRLASHKATGEALAGEAAPPGKTPSRKTSPGKTSPGKTSSGKATGGATRKVSHPAAGSSPKPAARGTPRRKR